MGRSVLYYNTLLAARARHAHGTFLIGKGHPNSEMAENTRECVTNFAPGPAAIPTKVSM